MGSVMGNPPARDRLGNAGDRDIIRRTRSGTEDKSGDAEAGGRTGAAARQAGPLSSAWHRKPSSYGSARLMASQSSEVWTPILRADRETSSPSWKHLIK